MMRTPRLMKVLLFLVVVGFTFNVILLFKMKASHNNLVPADSPQDHRHATVIDDHQPSDTSDKPVVWVYAKKVWLEDMMFVFINCSNTTIAIRRLKTLIFNFSVVGPCYVACVCCIQSVRISFTETWRVLGCNVVTRLPF